ncbi:MAG: DMT family transporter [Dehalococcoidia bacterium]|nr:DMT family transporter [Dehalococcoidia bacterium]MDZ4247460.1 DMT family transporter [Dehalococcoidia bacterium]
MGIFFAVISSIGWGVSAVLVGGSLHKMKVLPGTALSVVASFLTVAIITSLLQWDELVSAGWNAVLLFALVGVLSFTLGRFFNYLGIRRLGAARTTSITAAAPLFASITAIIFLKEVPNTLIISGTILVVVGLYLTMSSKQGKVEKGKKD